MADEALHWLHFSDLHFKKDDRFDQRLILNSFADFLRKRTKAGRRLDLIFLSGDIAYSGSEAEYVAAQEFMDDILDACALTRDRLILVPGNHDVDRTGIEWLAEPPQDAVSSDRYFSQDAPLPHLERGQHAFRTWYNSYFPERMHINAMSSCSPPISLNISNRTVAIQRINSAIFSRNGDQGHLLIGRKAIYEACDAIDDLPCDLRVAVMHHPIDWLKEFEQQSIRARISDSFDMLLRGHLHKNEAMVVSGPVESLITIAAGATYQTESYPNTAFLGSYNGGQIILEPIRYSPEPRPVWTVDPSLFPDSAEYKGTLPVAPHSEVPSDGKPGAAPSALVEFKPSQLRDHLLFSPTELPLYVEPRIMNLPQEQSNSGQDARRVSIEEIVDSDASYLIEAFPEYGATLLAKRIEVEITSRSNTAILRNSPNLPSYKAKLSKLFTEKAPGKKTTLIIDNFDPVNHSRMFKELQSLNVADRYILIVVARSNYQRSSASADGTYENVEFCFLWQISRSDVRTLATKLFDSNDSVFISAVVEKTYSDLLGLCIPLTPANVIMYLRVLFREENFSPLNRVEIVEEYISELLRKPSDIYSEAFNARNKTNIISAFAYDMYQKEVGEFSALQWMKFCDAHMKDTLVQFDSKKLLEDMVLTTNRFDL